MSDELDRLFKSLTPNVTPLPRPDPRSWADRLPRVQGTGEYTYGPQTRGEIIPELLMHALGVNPYAKGMPEYNPQDVIDWSIQRNTHPAIWEDQS